MSGSKWSVLGLFLAAFAVGCGGDDSGTSPGTGGTAGTAGGGTTASSGGSGGTVASTTTTGTASTTASSGGSGGTGGGATGDCPEGGLYALSDTALDENVVSMCSYKGDVLLIVNIAEA